MSVQLLDKTRKINKLLHNSSSSKVVFNDICQVLMETLSSNILVLSKKGKVLGVSICPGVDEITELIDDKIGGHIDPLLNERFLGVLSTKENVNLQTLGFEHVPGNYQGIVNPIDIAGERLGTLFIYKSDSQYDIDDIILSEYGTTVVGLEMMRSVNEENAEETRKVQIVKSAISTLSFSELEAIIHIFEELDGNEGILVASKIADRVGITRSVIVNALRKFESAGVIESRSSGMKGTYIKVLNDVVFDEFFVFDRSEVDTYIQQGSQNGSPGTHHGHAGIGYSVAVPFSGYHINHGQNGVDGTCHLHRHLGGIFGFLLYGFTADRLFFIRFFRKFECRENTVVCFRITVYIGYQLAGEFFETNRKIFHNFVHFYIFLAAYGKIGYHSCQ